MLSGPDIIRKRRVKSMLELKELQLLILPGKDNAAFFSSPFQHQPKSELDYLSSGW